MKERLKKYKIIRQTELHQQCNINTTRTIQQVNDEEHLKCKKRDIARTTLRVN